MKRSATAKPKTKKRRFTTVAKHARNLIRRYEPAKDAEEVVASAKTLAKVVLRSRLLDKHKKHILSVVQWLISEVDGKYTTRYRSKKVVDLANKYLQSSGKKVEARRLKDIKRKAHGELIQHEHVNTRKYITNEIMENPDRVDSILDQVIGCVVSKSEHGKLRKRGTGWARYRNRVPVYDMSFEPPRPMSFR